ncbi:MAG: sporulation protein YabP [bacterium]
MEYIVEDKKKSKHNIAILNRTNMKITGVLDVISFDEEMIVAETELGIMILKGIDFHISKLNLNSGDLEVDGEIYNLIYEDKTTYSKAGGSIFNKIFK